MRRPSINDATDLTCRTSEVDPCGVRRRSPPAWAWSMPSSSSSPSSCWPVPPGPSRPTTRSLPITRARPVACRAWSGCTSCRLPSSPPCGSSWPSGCGRRSRSNARTCLLPHFTILYWQCCRLGPPRKGFSRPVRPSTLDRSTPSWLDSSRSWQHGQHRVRRPHGRDLRIHHLQHRPHAGVLPRWFANLGFAVGVFMLLSVTLNEALVLVFPTWLVSLSAILSSRPGRSPRT